jgi:hypothetical protein
MKKKSNFGFKKDDESFVAVIDLSRGDHRIQFRILRGQKDWSLFLIGWKD